MILKILAAAMAVRPRLEISEPEPALLLARAAGAVAGSLISLAYVLPRGRREAMLRLLVGVVSGIVFGSTAGIKIANTLGVLGKISGLEVTLIGAAFTSLTAWWALGVLQRLAEHTPTRELRAPLIRSIRRADEMKEDKT